MPVQQRIQHTPLARVHRLLTLALSLLLPLSLGCDTELNWFVIETEVSEICVVDVVAEFEGADSSGMVSKVLGGEDLGITLSEKISAEMFLTGVGFATMEGADGLAGVENFDFVESLRVQVSAGGEAPVELVNYVSSEAKGTDWFVDSTSAVDIAKYIEAKDLELSIEFRGSLPQTAWRTTVQVCMSAQVAYKESL